MTSYFRLDVVRSVLGRLCNQLLAIDRHKFPYNVQTRFPAAKYYPFSETLTVLHGYFANPQPDYGCNFGVGGPFQGRVTV
jgi:hypothetical protein